MRGTSVGALPRAPLPTPAKQEPVQRDSLLGGEGQQKIRMRCRPVFIAIHVLLKNAEVFRKLSLGPLSSDLGNPVGEFSLEPFQRRRVHQESFYASKCGTENDILPFRSRDRRPLSLALLSVIGINVVIRSADFRISGERAAQCKGRLASGQPFSR